jgi:uncharacterized protein (TIGR02301 family)
MTRPERAASTLPRLAMIAMAASVMLLAPVSAMAAEAKPYDDKLMRLSEILGAVHYLRELCGAGENQLWRDRMRDLIAAEGSTALRRAQLTRSFNKGYNSYSRTYNACTQSAKTAVDRFLIEGAQLSEELVKAYP